MWYFVPAEGGTQGLVRAARLEYAFSDSPHATLIPNTKGPDGLAGTVLSSDATLPAVVWHKRELSPSGATLGVWLGFNAANSPGPESLSRADVLRTGWSGVQLGDGRTWLVPLVYPCTGRDAGRRCNLPGKAVANATGLRFEPGAAYDELRFSLSRIFERVISEGELIQLAADLLAAGYRVTIAEVLALGLLTTATAHAVVAAAIDLHERIAVGATAEEPEACTLLIRGLAGEQRVDEGAAGRAIAAAALVEAE